MRPQVMEEVIKMIKKYLNSKWWHLTAAAASIATVGYVVYIAYAYHVIMTWFLIASLFMSVYEIVKFAAHHKKA
jgi:hypothetical protein